MKTFLAFIWRQIRKCKYIKKNIFIKSGVKFNRQTEFEGYNLIYEKCSLYNSFIGRGTYIGPGSKIINTSIGRFCSIGEGVKVVLGRHPLHTWVSTHPSFYSQKKQAGFTMAESEKWDTRKIIGKENYECMIGNDVWIGDNVMILSGIEINDGCVLGAGTIVTKNTEPYGIYVGIPARKIGQRFDDKDIEILLKNKWWDKEMESIKEHIDEFESIEKYKNYINREYR